MKNRIFLASASPRRHELLKQIGVKHHVLDIPAAPGEDEPRLQNENPLEYVQRTALEKAIRAREYLNSKNFSIQCVPTLVGTKDTLAEIISSAAVLTADTTVALGEIILGKPSDAADAKRILKLLSGQTHSVHTAIVLCWKNQQWKVLSSTRVTFDTVSEKDITDYIATQEPFGKAGAYGIQGHAAKFISRIEGSYSGVMGLPLFETANVLKQIST